MYEVSPMCQANVQGTVIIFESRKSRCVRERTNIYMNYEKQGKVKHIEGDVEGRSAVLALVVRKARHD